MSVEPTWSVRAQQISTVFLAILGVCSTALGIFTSFRANEAAENTRFTEQAAAERREARDVETLRRQYEITVFDKAYAALGTERPQQQQAALALVLSLNDSGMRDGLISAFGLSATPEVRTQALQAASAEGEFAAQAAADVRDASGEAVSRQPAGPNTIVLAPEGDGFDIDVFWCGGGPQAPQRQALGLQIAERLADISRTGRSFGPTTLSRVRLRLLPESTNATPEYRLTSNVVLFDPSLRQDAREEEVAAALLTEVQNVSRIAVSPVPRASGSTWYLSVFICGTITPTA